MTKAMPFLQKAILLSYDPRPFRTGFFASKNPEKSTHSAGKYDLRSICLFFCKGHL